MNKIPSSEPNIPDKKNKILNNYLIHYTDYDTEEEASSIDYKKYCTVLFDDILESKQNDFSPFFTRGRHEKIDVFFITLKF